MDGPVIQAATTEALANGFRVRQVFDVVAGITSKHRCRRPGHDLLEPVVSAWAWTSSPAAWPRPGEQGSSPRT